jgi:hypothetical protein
VLVLSSVAVTSTPRSRTRATLHEVARKLFAQRDSLAGTFYVWAGDGAYVLSRPADYSRTPASKYWVRDAWGEPLRFRCPGVVPSAGWDLYSTGPNRADEQGGGDDIVITGEIADITSGW